MSRRYRRETSGDSSCITTTTTSPVPRSAALATARKELYRILAEDAAEADAGQDAGA